MKNLKEVKEYLNTFTMKGELLNVSDKEAQEYIDFLEASAKDRLYDDTRAFIWEVLRQDD